MRYLIIAASLLLAGCGQQFEDLMDSLAGHETQRIILAKEPVTVGPASLKLKSTEPMRVLGGQAHVCLALKGGVPLSSQPPMEKIYDEALGGAELSGALTLDNGQVFQFSGTSEAWSKYGRITAGDEIAACLSCNCGPKPPVGALVSQVEIRASRAVRVLGIYWESTNAFDTPVNTGSR